MEWFLFLDEVAEFFSTEHSRIPFLQSQQSQVVKIDPSNVIGDKILENYAYAQHVF